MNLEFIARANAIVLELERRGQTVTADAMMAVVANYEIGQMQTKKIPKLNCNLDAETIT